jgi:transcriptional regulator with XRE-family HTH domain
MALKDRIELRLAATGMNASQASRAAGMSVDVIRNIRRGLSKSAGGETLIALATVLQTSVEYLLGQTDDPSPTPPQGAGFMVAVDYLSVRFEVGRGYWVADASRSVDQNFIIPIPTSPKYQGVDQWLERVIGTTSRPKFDPGDILHIVSIVGWGYRPLTGDYVVCVRRKNNQTERSIRRVVVQADGKGGSDVMFADISDANETLETGRFDPVGKVIGRYQPLE